MKISVLIDNSACQDHPELEAEHGLFFFIEQGNTRILCDMGVSSAFSDNAEKMGIDLQSADWAFVSHGHRDHSGGLEMYLQSCRGEVWLSRHVFGHRFYSLRHTDKREISTAPQLEKEFSSRFRYLDGSWEEIARTALDYTGERPLLLAVIGAGDIEQIFRHLPGSPADAK